MDSIVYGNGGRGGQPGGGAPRQNKQMKEGTAPDQDRRKGGMKDGAAPEQKGRMNGEPVVDFPSQ